MPGMHKDDLLKKIGDHSARVGVVGLGYVGLPFAVEKAKVGFHVTGIERNKERVNQVNQGENYIVDVNDQELREQVASGRIRATTTFDDVADLDVIVICVPTPLTKNQTPELFYVEHVTRAIGESLRPGQLISLESTTYPGTTEEVMRPILEEASGLVAERDFYLAHSPERVDPGNQRYTTKNTNKVVGGVGPNSLEVAQAFYQQTIDTVVPVSSAQAAELVKVFENTFRAVNIALVNELMLLCHRVGLNVWEVLDAAFTKPFGIMPFYPGPGVGGHCIPIDPHYLEWKAREYDFNTHFIALAGEVNRSIPYFVRDRISNLLNKRGLSMSGASILFLGAAYKKDLGDTRESPAIKIMELVLQDGANITVHDPFVESLHIQDRDIVLVDDVLTAAASADLVLLTTDHTDVPYAEIAKVAPTILDTRNVFGQLESAYTNVVPL